MAEESIGEFVADYVLRDQVQDYFEHHWSKDYIYPIIPTILTMAVISMANDVVGAITGDSD